MKPFLLLFLTLMISSAELIVEVSGVKNAKGKVGLLVFTSKEGFPEDRKKAAYEIQLKAQKGVMRFKIPDLKAGQFGFVVLHDENENQKLDKTFIGYPKEGIAIPNYQKLARPKFAKAVLKTPKSPVKLKMLYP